MAGFFSAAGDGGTALLGEPGGVGLRTYGEGTSTGNAAISIIGSESSTTLLGANTAAGLSFLIRGEMPNRSGATLSGGSDVQVSGDVYVYGRLRRLHAIPDDDDLAVPRSRRRYDDYDAFRRRRRRGNVRC